MLSKKKSDLFVWGLLALIVLVGALFRLYDLGGCALHSDGLNFWRICQQDVSAKDIFNNWMKLMGLSAQFPFAVSAAKFVIDVLHLPVTFFSIRLSSALWGIATVVSAFFVGKQFRDKWLGLVMAFILAISPLVDSIVTISELSGT